MSDPEDIEDLLQEWDDAGEEGAFADDFAETPLEATETPSEEVIESK